MRRTRKVWAVGTGVLTATLASAVMATATGGDNTQSIDAVIKPLGAEGLPKDDFAKSKLTIETATFDAGTPAARPDPAVKALIHFDDDIKFDRKGIALCEKDLIEGTDTATAKSLCAKAKVGQGTASVRLSAGPYVVDLPATVTAFNGVGRKPTILLHSRIEAGDRSVTAILVGKIVKSSKGGDFGKALKVNIEPLQGGLGSLTNFRTSVKKTSTVDGKKHFYISARCQDANKTLNYDSTFTFDQTGPPYGTVGDGSGNYSVDATDKHKCNRLAPNEG